MAADNHLIHESSPYLQQHAHNPVDWYPWGEAAFARARKEDKPIFLSIGYSTCHWCHVMEQESFEDPEVGRAMNATFISIKVDREERPDIDHIYMQVAQMMNGNGGWPLNVVLTPDRKPFYAATYLPKTSRFGRMGLLELTAKIDELWHNDRQRLLASADSITDALRKPTLPEDGDHALNRTLLTAAVTQLEADFDREHGGFGDAPKFPSAHKLLLLLRMGKTAMVEQTLDAMRAGGIYDQIGFGFHRYSTDNHWLVPHFEKMLYDQAMLMRAYAEAYAATGHRRHAVVVREIAEFVAREMTDDEGAFYSALDADSKGGEGRFYQWTTAEIAEALGDDAPFAAETWGIERRGNYLDEAKRLRNQRNIPYLRQPPLDADKPRLERIRRKLLAARNRRPHPFRDDKVLTDWNGMMIGALSYAAGTLDDATLLQQAERAARTVVARAWDGKQLRHRWRNGVMGIDGQLDDYASLVAGLIALYQADFDPQWLLDAVAINKAMVTRFAAESGGFYLTSADNKLLMRPQEWFDGAIPAGNSVAVMNLLQLSHLTGDTALAAEAERALKQAAPLMARAAGGSAYLLCALRFALNPVRELVLAGTRGDPTMQQMERLAHRGYHPGMVLLHNDSRLHAVATFLKEQQPIDGRPTAYLCENFVCNRPVTTVAALKELLGR